MGADGGSIPDRTDLVRTKAKAQTVDKAVFRELYFFCALSKRLLSKPVVLDPLGKLYNKDALIEYFLDKTKYGDGDQICGYLKGVKDLLTLNLTDNPEYSPPISSTTHQTPLKAPFVCPLSLREMNGAVPFIAVRHCGCVFSDAAVRAVIPNLTKGIGAKPKLDQKPDEARPVVDTKDREKVGVATCPNCGKEFDPTLSNAVQPIYPSKEVQETLLENLLVSRATAKASKKRKVIDSVSLDPSVPAKAIKIATTPLTDGTPKSHRDSPVPPHLNGSNGRSTPPVPVNGRATPPVNSSVKQKLAEQEQKRLAAQAGMSDAVRSMFKPKGEEQKGGTAEFFGRTFTRYA